MSPRRAWLFARLGLMGAIRIPNSYAVFPCMIKRQGDEISIIPRPIVEDTKNAEVCNLEHYNF
jgi:hypothetical protein